MNSPMVSLTRDSEGVKITWNGTTIPREFVTKLRRIITKNNTYGKELLPALRYLVQSNPDDGVTLGAALNMQHAYTKAKIIRNYWRLAEKASLMERSYKGDNILDVAKKFDSPPMLVFKLIMEYRGVDSKLISQMLRGEAKPFDPADAKQLEIAMENDAESFPNTQAIAEAAMCTEGLFINWLRESGVKLKTENDLRAEQEALSGRASLTPDALFQEPVFINGTRVAWIDFKNYCGVDAPYLIKSNLNQAKKYHIEWGVGAICYRHGFIEGLPLEEFAIPLDGRSVPIGWECKK